MVCQNMDPFLMKQRMYQGAATATNTRIGGSIARSLWRATQADGNPGVHCGETLAKTAHAPKPAAPPRAGGGPGRIPRMPATMREREKTGTCRMRPAAP